LRSGTIQNKHQINFGGKNLGKKYLLAFGLSLTIGALVYWAIQWWFQQKTQAVSVSGKLQMLNQWEQLGIPDFAIAGLGNLYQQSYPIKIIHFWASWCGPCVEELPSLTKLADMYRDRIFIAALSQDYSETEMNAFLKSHQLHNSTNLIYVFDQKPRLSSVYQVEKLPESYIADKKNRLIKRISGSIEWVTDESKAFFDHHLNKSVD